MLVNLMTCTSIIDAITQNEVTHRAPVPKREKKKLVECHFVTRASPDWHQETFQSTIDRCFSRDECMSGCMPGTWLFAMPFDASAGTLTCF